VSLGLTVAYSTSVEGFLRVGPAGAPGFLFTA